ncbi:MAG TPA: cell division protein FtsQ/DivIB [Xanthobacteraceae bacterium]|nr:cell division protein FtsQ/DivIB [Xanthobacteraceae bacterium]
MRMADLRPPRWAGAAASALLILASIGYGVAKGGHGPMIAGYLTDARDAAANAAGFRIAGVSLSGEKQVSRAEIFAAAGVTARASLLFLDVDHARARLKAIPWIADATVRKLYPDRLQITVTERDAFALWQLDGKVSVISADGTVVGPLVDWHFAHLPLVVGAGAAAQAQDFLAVLDAHPDIRRQVRASVLVAERRWNLKLKNGVDVRLPESDVAQALDRLADLDRDKRLIGRDIAAIDLRLPDRVSVTLSDEAAEARAEAFKDKKVKHKGGDA